MSGTSNPLYVAPPDPLGALLKFAQGQQAQAGIGQTQAQTGLLGAQTGLTQQQTTGAELNNQQLQLMLGLRGALANSILPGSAPQGAGSGVLPPAATGGPAAGGGPPTNGQSAVAAADAQLPPAVTPFGATMSPFGVPLPRAQMIAAVMSGDPLKGVTDAYNMGRQRIVSLLTQAGNPQQVQDAAKQLYQEGWLDQRGYSNIYNHPESRQAFIDSMASPDAHMTQFTALTGQGLSKDENGNVQINPTAVAAEGAIAGSRAQAEVGPGVQKAVQTAAGTLPYDVLKEQARPHAVQPNEKYYIPPVPGQAPAPGQTPAIGTAGGGNAIAVPGDALSKLPPAQQAIVRDVALRSHEDPNVVAAQWSVEDSAKLTPTQGAGGATPGGTYGALQMKQVALDDYNQKHGTNLSIDDIANNARLGLQIGTDYRIDRTQARGNNAVLGAMDYDWGAGNVDKWLAGGANPNAVPPETQKYVRALYGPNAMGMAQAAPAAGVAPGATTVPGPQGNLTVTPTPGGGTVVAGGGQLPIAQAEQLAKRQSDFVTAESTRADQAALQNSKLEQMGLESQGFTMGRWADIQGTARAVLDSMGQGYNAMTGTQTYTPSQALGDWQAFNKNAMELVRTAVKDTSSRAAVQEFQLIQKALPTDTMAPQSFAIIKAQMQGVNDWYQARSLAASQMLPTATPEAFKAHWDNNISPYAFAIQRMDQAQLATLHTKMMASAAGKAMWNDWIDQTKWLESQGFIGKSLNTPRSIPISGQPGTPGMAGGG